MSQSQAPAIRYSRLVNQSPIFYGWVILLMGTLGMIMTSPGQTYAVSIFIEHFITDLGISRGLVIDPTHEAMLQTIANDEPWTLLEARRTLSFWVLGLGLAAIAMLSTGLFFHMVSIFTDNGLDAMTAAWVYLPIAVTTALVNLGSGVLADRIPARILLAIALLLQTTSLFMAQYLQGIELSFPYGVTLGATMGLMGTVHGVGWAKYFGRKYLGSITGTGTAILIVGAALGPMPLGIARDWLGSYNLALTLGAVIPFSLAIASLGVGQPHKFG